MGMDGNGIFIHLVDFCGKCGQIHHTWILWETKQSENPHEEPTNPHSTYFFNIQNTGNLPPKRGAK